MDKNSCLNRSYPNVKNCFLLDYFNIIFVFSFMKLEYGMLIFGASLIVLAGVHSGTCEECS